MPQAGYRTSSNMIFAPSTRSLSGGGTFGSYWTKNLYSDDPRKAYSLLIGGRQDSYPPYEDRSYGTISKETREGGYPVRPVITK